MPEVPVERKEAKSVTPNVPHACQLPVPSPVDGAGNFVLANAYGLNDDERRNHGEYLADKKTFGRTLDTNKDTITEREYFIAMGEIYYERLPESLRCNFSPPKWNPGTDQMNQRSIVSRWGGEGYNGPRIQIDFAPYQKGGIIGDPTYNRDPEKSGVDITVYRNLNPNLTQKFVVNVSPEDFPAKIEELTRKINNNEIGEGEYTLEDERVKGQGLVRDRPIRS